MSGDSRLSSLLADAVTEELHAVREAQKLDLFPCHGGERVPAHIGYAYICQKARRRTLPYRPGDPVWLILDDGTVHPMSYRAQDSNRVELGSGSDLGPTLSSFVLAEDLSWLLAALASALGEADDRHQLSRALLDPSVPLARSTPTPFVVPHPSLNPQQLEVVSAACTQPILFVWGPAGTGKSLTLSHIALEHLARGESVLLLAPTNAVVDRLALEVGQRLLEHPIEDVGLVMRVGAASNPTLMAHHRSNLKWGQRQRPLKFPVDVWAGPVNEVLRARLRNASMAITTVPRTHIGDGLGRRFDVVMIDECSMVTLPALFAASQLADQRVVVAGDYVQLGPIIQSEGPLAREWLRRDIWDVQSIPTLVSHGLERANLRLLTTQYRMSPAIMDLVNTMWYHDRLVAAGTCPGSPAPDAVLGTEPLVIVDTSHGPLKKLKRFGNAFHADVSAALAARLGPHGPTAVVARFVDQTRAIRHVLGGSDSTVRVDTVHSTQGDEAQSVVIDVSASPIHYGGDWVVDRDPRSSGDRLLAVAASRAQSRLVLVANLAHLRTMPDDTVLARLIREFVSRGSVVRAEDVLGARDTSEAA